ncbi:MAG: DUF3850 domain-containing protein [Sneathiella sp.]
MTTHIVKSWTHLFQAAKDGVKTHDIRDRTEREYRVGDYLVLKEFDFVRGEYTGDELLTKITYITDRDTPCAMSSNGLAQDLCILSIQRLGDDEYAIL